MRAMVSSWRGSSPGSFRAMSATKIDWASSRARRRDRHDRMGIHARSGMRRARVYALRRERRAGVKDPRHGLAVLLDGLRPDRVERATLRVDEERAILAYPVAPVPHERVRRE